MPAMFSMHMVAHMGLSMLVPILLVLGAPVSLALRALPAAGRKTRPACGNGCWPPCTAGCRGSSPTRSSPPCSSSPASTGCTSSSLFDIAVGSHAGHLAMNVHFLLSGYLFYWIVIGVDPTPRPIPPLAKVGVVFASLPLHAFFGVVLMGTRKVLGADYYRSLGLSWHTDLLGDQRLGGGIAWAAGELPLVIVMLALLVQWARSDRPHRPAVGPRRRTRRRRRAGRLQRDARRAGAARHAEAFCTNPRINPQSRFFPHRRPALPDSGRFARAARRWRRAQWQPGRAVTRSPHRMSNREGISQCSKPHLPSSVTSSTTLSAARSAIRRSSNSGWPATRVAAPVTAAGSRELAVHHRQLLGQVGHRCGCRVGQGRAGDRGGPRVHQRVRGPRRQSPFVAGDAGDRGRTGPVAGVRAHREAAVTPVPMRSRRGGRRNFGGAVDVGADEDLSVGDDPAGSGDDRG